MEIRTVAKLLLWLGCAQLVFANRLTIPLNVSGTEAYRTSPAEVEFLQVVTLLCTEHQTAVYNINSTQYDSCSEPMLEDYQNIHIGDCGSTILIVVNENIIQTTVNYKPGETFYFAVYSISSLGVVTGTEPCNNGIKFKLHVVDETEQTTTSSLVTSTTETATTIPRSTPTVASVPASNLTHSINSRSSTPTTLPVTLTTIVESTKTLDSLRTPLTRPISSGLGEAESTASFPDYAIGAVVGGLVGAAALAVIVLVILAVVYQKRRRISRTIYITTEKEHYKNCEMISNKKLSTPCATNRLSYEFMDDLDQIGGVSTFKRDLSEGGHHDEHKIDLSVITGEPNFV